MRSRQTARNVQLRLLTTRSRSAADAGREPPEGEPMTGRFKSFLFLFATIAFVLTLNLASYAEASRALITQKIDESQLVTLAGNTRPEANAVNDRGPVSADL